MRPPSRFYMAALVAVLLFSTLQPFAGYDISSGSADGPVLISEVYPYTASEGISLHNYGNSSIDLSGYSISDGEGILTFTSGLLIPAGSRITVVKTAGDDWFSSRESVLEIESSGIRKTGSYALADAGDGISLYRNEVLVDSVCYNVSDAPDGWSGATIRISSKEYALRTGPFDTNTAKDWNVTKPGWTGMGFHPESYFTADVSPFTFPESCGVPIYDAFEDADSEILISIYMLTSPNLIALLCELEERTQKHVDVKITLEGDVLGYDMSTELSLMKSLSDAGGEVCLINDSKSGNYERYSYFHNKYAIIDGDTVVITSENWTDSNMGGATGNRGWGAVIESKDYAEYMKRIFENDRQSEYGDVWNISDRYQNLKPYAPELHYDHPDRIYDTETFPATVVPILSPDNSFEALRSLIDGSESRVYAEQLDLSSSFSYMTDLSPIYWMSQAADRGIDARFILDSSISGTSEAHIAEVNLINETSSVKAITIDGGDGFDMVHNKGVLIDDSVWLGSVNWTSTSFDDNREAAALISSKEVSDYFCRFFLEDWGVNMHTIEEDGLRITMVPSTITEDSVVVFSISGPDDCTYIWDVPGDGSLRSSSIPDIVCTGLKAGTYTMSVSVEGTAYSAYLTYTVAPGEKSGEGEGPSEHVIQLIIAASLAVAGLVLSLVRGRVYKNRDR
jgi:phosphatidylserine/phosphatidylglycerophosphate/cardiolipin synthase-like enzyme